MQAKLNPLTRSTTLTANEASDFMCEAYERLRTFDVGPDGSPADAACRVWNLVDAYSAAMMAQWIYALLGDEETADQVWALCDSIMALLLGRESAAVTLLPN